jgi:hypothetical protein
MRYLKIPFIVLACALLALLPRSGQAQRAGNAAYERARLSLPAPQRTAFAEIVANAKSRGLPVDPLVDKVLEGKAKRRPPDEIITVVKKRVDFLARAQKLGSYRSPVELIAVADALNRGIPEKTIRQMRAGSRPNEPIGLAVHTLADLLDKKIPQAIALDVISGWRSRGASAAELRELPASVERLVRHGASPSYAGSAVASALHAGRAASTAQMAADLRANARTAQGSAANVRRQAGTAAAARSSTTRAPMTSAAARAKPKAAIKGQ